MLERARQLANMLDFDGCIEAIEKIDNMEMIQILLDRMEELDEARFINYCNEY